MLDEPAARFAPAERARLVKIQREPPQDITLLLIEHDMDIALATAHRVVVMLDGERVLKDLRMKSVLPNVSEKSTKGGSINDVA